MYSEPIKDQIDDEELQALLQLWGMDQAKIEKEYDYYEAALRPWNWEGLRKSFRDEMTSEPCPVQPDIGVVAQVLYWAGSWCLDPAKIEIDADEHKALLKPWDLEGLRKSFRDETTSEPYPVPPDMVADLSQADLDFLTNHFKFEPRIWGKTYHRFNKSIPHGYAVGRLERTICYLAPEVARAPMLLIVAAAYNVFNSPFREELGM